MQRKEQGHQRLRMFRPQRLSVGVSFCVHGRADGSPTLDSKLQQRPSPWRSRNGDPELPQVPHDERGDVLLRGQLHEPNYEFHVHYIDMKV